MNDMHLSREILRAIASGDLPPRTLLDIALPHLLDLCPNCASEWEAYQRELRSTNGSFSRTLTILPTLLERELPKARAEERQARQDLSELVRMPEAKRMGRVRRSYRRFRTSALAQLLIEECRKRLPSAPREARHFAELAREVANQLSESPVARELQALTLGEVANAVRAEGDLPQSDRLFRQVRHLTIVGGVTDPEILARLDSLEGSLRSDQCRFREAEEVLERARFHYDLLGDRTATGRVQMQLANVYHHRGETARAVRLGTEALGHFDPESDLWLYLAARRNLATYLAGAGRREEALTILDEDEDRHRDLGEPLLQIRYTWLRGKIALDQGEIEDAVRCLTAVRDVFTKAENGFDAALASLDLAQAYLAAGRPAETKRIASDIVPMFEANEVHREALAALLLFRDAAERESLTASWLRDLGAFLEASRSNRSLRFEPNRRTGRPRVKS